jgi:hypothetical protein
MAERDTSASHRHRAERWLEGAEVPTRSDEAWEAQVQSILAKAQSSAIEAAPLDAPLPRASAEPEGLEPPKPAVVEALSPARKSAAPRRQRPGPTFTWLLAGVVGLAAAALVVVRVRHPALEAPPQKPVAAAQSVVMGAPPEPAQPPARAEEPAPEPVPSPGLPAKALERVAQRPAGKRSASRIPAQPAVPSEQVLEPNPALKPADGRQPLEDHPSGGAVSAALESVLDRARACLAPGAPAVPVELVFASDGHAQAVNIIEKTVPQGDAGCVRAALGKARVPPFARPSWSVHYTVRTP